MAKSLKIYWSKTALEDLIQASDYIAKDNPKAAKKFLNQTQRQVSLIKNHPYMGRIGRISKTRELMIKDFPYIIIYMIQPKNIKMVATIHTSKQYP